MFSLKNVETQLVLLCFRSNMMKKHWFRCVFVQTWWKPIGFIVFSIKHYEKPSVLLNHGFGVRVCNTQMVKKHWFYCVFSVPKWKLILNNKKVQKKHVFFQSNFCSTTKMKNNTWFYYKTRTKTIAPRIRGPGLQYSSWISCEEPLQPCCLGNKKLGIWKQNEKKRLSKNSCL